MDSRFTLASAGGSLKIINIGASSSRTSTSGSGGGSLMVHSTAAITRDSFPHRDPGTGQTFTIANEPILLQLHDGKQYLVDESSISNIDQMPPENLIYMNPTTAAVAIDGGDGSFETTEEQLVQLVACEELTETSRPLQSNEGSSGNDQQQQQQYKECEELVMEEVITDDWVQSQGDECVTVSIDQLGGSTVGGTSLEDDISVPLDQDMYTLSRPFPCDFCSRRFRKMTSLEQHLLCHSNVRLHTCNLCNTHFEKRSDLTVHLQQHAFLSNENDESFASDHGGDYDTTISRANQQYRSHHSSDDDDNAMYIENAGMGYNAQPPMQLISTSPSYGSTPHTTSANRSLMPGAGPSTMSASKAFSDQQSLRSKQARSPRSGRSARPFIKQEPDTLPSYPNAEEDVSSSVRFSVKDPRKPFVCQQCGVGFAREKALDSHSRIHGGDSKIECSMCGEMFWNRAQLQSHVRQRHSEGQQKGARKRKTPAPATHNPKASSSSATRGHTFDIDAPQTDDFDLLLDPQYDCDNCGATFTQPDRLKRHIQQKHGLVPIGYDASIVKQEVNVDTSTGCDYQQQRQLQLQEQNKQQQHELDEHDPQEEDDEEMDSDDDYGEDRAMATLDKSSVYEGNLSSLDTELAVPIKCQLCGETFQSDHEIKQHLQEQHMEQMTPTSCVICGKRCTNQASLIKHSWDHSRVRRHCCPQCDKTFHHKARLKRHMESHRNKSVKCEQCGEDFPDGRSLMNHRHSHTKSSKFPCTECGKTFGSRSSQQIHIRIHTGERPYACRFCWKAFADGGTLRKHERIHTGEKPYGCSVCTKAFNQRVVLREHIRAHHSQIDSKRGTAEQPYYCDACGALFATSNELVQHLIEHSDKTTADKRKPQIFPRKYKRRRKLKPQELERLQSGRRKKKSSTTGTNRSTSQEEFDEDDEQEAATAKQRPPQAQDDSNGQLDHDEDTDSSMEHRSDTTSANNSLDNGDGSLKISSELFLDYGGSVQKVIASPKFISPYELLDDAQKEADQFTTKPSSHTSAPAPNAGVDGEMIIMDDHGINLLSEVVLVHGVNNNHDASKKATAETKQLVSGSMSRTISSHVKAKRTSSSSSLSPSTKDSGNKKQLHSSVCTPTKDGFSSPSLKTGNTNNATPTGTTSATNSMSTFPVLASSRLHGSRVLPSYVREISSSRISSGSFPLLDDGKSAHDTLEDEEALIGEQSSIDHATTDGRGGAVGSEERRKRRRHFSSTSSCYDHGTVNDEDELNELNQRLLSEISNRDRYTDRYNSDIVNDLAEILRSPIKTVPTNGPPRDILATPTVQRALHFFEATPATTVSKMDALLPLDEVKQETVDEDTQPSRVEKRETANRRRNNTKNPKSSKQQTKRVSSGSVRTGSSPLRIPRLTRRQLEKEINFLKEAFEGGDTSTGAMDSLPVETIRRLSRDSFSTDENKSTLRDRQNAKTNASEELATMLLNDQIPTTSSSEQQREKQWKEDSTATTIEDSAVTIVKQEAVEYSDDNDNDDDMFGGFASDGGQEASDGESMDFQSATTASFAGFRCSICDECFEERKQLMLHVQLHI